MHYNGAVTLTTCSQFEPSSLLLLSMAISHDQLKISKIMCVEIFSPNNVTALNHFGFKMNPSGLI